MLFAGNHHKTHHSFRCALRSVAKHVHHRFFAFGRKGERCIKRIEHPGYLGSVATVDDGNAHRKPRKCPKPRGLALPDRLAAGVELRGQRQEIRVASLKVHVVGSRRAATRTVVEHGHPPKLQRQTAHILDAPGYTLVGMRRIGDCQMTREDGEGVDENLIAAPRLGNLLRRAVGGA